MYLYTLANDMSKGKNRYLLKVTRVFLFQNNVPTIYWSDAVFTAIYLINRLSSVILNFKSPLKILYQEKNNISYLRVFGCICYVHKNKFNKLDYTSIKATFLGYSSQKKSYECYDPINKKILYLKRCNIPKKWVLSQKFGKINYHQKRTKWVHISIFLYSRRRRVFSRKWYRN